MCFEVIALIVLKNGTPIYIYNTYYTHRPTDVLSCKIYILLSKKLATVAVMTEVFTQSGQIRSN